MNKVLVVDDSISVRKALERILAPQQLSVVLAESGEKALSLMADAQPELVIADVVMPGMTGFELCQTLRADEKYHAIPVLLISGIVNASVENQARQAGALGVVKKPFAPDDLFPKIKQALQKREQALSQAAMLHPISHQPVSQQPVSQRPAPQQAAPVPPVATPQPSVFTTQVVPPQMDRPFDTPVAPTPALTRAPEPATPKPAARPAAQLKGELRQRLLAAVNPMLEKSDVVSSVMLVDGRGNCIVNVGQEPSDKTKLAGYIKFITSAAMILGDNIGDKQLKSLVLEYSQQCVVVTKTEKIVVAMVLRDITSLSIARYVLKKQIPEIDAVLKPKQLVQAQ